VTLSQAFGLLVLLAFIAGGIWAYFRLLKFADDPARIIFKTVLTTVLLALYGGFIAPMIWNGYGAVVAIPLAALTGVIIALIWFQHIGNAMARPFENLFTGGSRPPDPEPFFSIARAKRQQQRFDEAIAEIEKQLLLFPDDFKGLMLKAEIQATNLRDLSGATETIERICTAHAVRPRYVAAALSALADWQLQIGRDCDAARNLFQRICDTYPGQPVALDASQRLAHLPTQEAFDAAADRRPITLTEMPKVVIRDPAEVHVKVKAESPDEAIGRLVGHLELHPQDRAAREELAGHYAHHLTDATLAVEQLEWLARQPNQDKKHVVHWLNLIADYHVRPGNDLAAAEAALKRIEQRFPGSPAAIQAGRRKMLLVRELKGNEKGREVSLGSYEKDLGLR